MTVNSTPELAGEVAIVTGSSRGIGRAVALALAEAGADVAVTYRDRETEAEGVRSQISDRGRDAVSIGVDVSDADDVDSMAETVEETLGNASILVNNAGIARAQSPDEITETDWDEVIDVNLKSVFLVTRAVLPRMRDQQWGRIVNMSSAAVQLGGIIGPHYTASKAGILGLTRSYASLLADEGITVNAIAPALVQTDMIAGNPNATPDVIPVGRLGSTEEVADVVVTLARNGYITGQTINVNGGMYMG